MSNGDDKVPRLARRTRRRGALDKAIAFARARAARLSAAPPLPAGYPPRDGESALAILRALAGAAGGAAARLDVLAQRLPWDSDARPTARGSASALVLACEGCFFDGSYTRCEALRAELEPLGAARPLIIASDVIVSETQMRRAQRAGADAIAPVTHALTRAGYSLAELARTARDVGLLVIPECAEPAHLEAARAAGLAAVIVSLRDRDTWRPCPEPAAALIAQASDLLTFQIFAAQQSEANPD